MSIQSEINRLKNNVAATYAAMEEQGATMPTQQNSANMAATARTIPTGGGGGTTVQADWSVNDPSNARYVKNRTHWKEVFDGPEGEVISETEVSFTSNIKTVTGAMSDGIQVGGLYVVSWNGTDYECVGKSGSDGNYIGNGSFMNAGSITFEDTGEPFCVLLFGGTYYQLWKGSTTAETVTVKVVGKKETVWHKLDSRFLNEALQFGSETKVILPETTSEVVAEMEGAPIFDVLSVEVGKTYTVMWNGTEYVCTAQATPPADISGALLGNAGAITGGELTEEPFIIMCLDAGSAAALGFGGLASPLDGSETVTLSITYNGIKKINGKYLPDGLPYVEIAATDVLPETVYEVNPDSGSADFMANLSLVDGQTYTVKYNGVEYSCVCSYVVMEMAAYVLGNLGALMGEEGTGEPFVFMYIPDAGFAAVFPMDGSLSFPFSIHGKTEIVHKLSSKFLTDGVPYAEPFDDVIMAAWPSSITSEGTFTDPTGTLVAGNIYKVNWGGTIYECTAKETADLGVSLGNLSALGGEATTDPFGILLVWPSVQAEMGASGIIFFDNAPANYEFSIIGGWKVQKIDKRCLPAMQEPVFIPITKASGKYSCNVSQAAIKAFLTGEVPRLVYLVKPNSLQASEMYRFESQVGSTLWFSQLNVYSDTVKIELLGVTSGSTTLTQITKELA